jgi:opacity protein-like surface antigen
MDTCFKEDSKNRLGLKIGTNFSRLTGAYWKYIANEYANQILERTVLDIKGMPGLYGSIFYNYTINNNFGVQVEITGQTNGTAVEAGIDSPGVKTTLDKYQLHFAYVTIPILLQPAYHFNKSISVHLNIGVEAEILARAVKIYESSKSSKTNIKNLSSKYNAGYIAGIEGVYCTSKGAEFSTEIRYEGCLFTVFKNDYPKAHRQMITINFGYTIKKI